MKSKSFFLLLIIIVSWGFEFLWIRYDLTLDLRLAGIHLIPLFLVPLASIWFLSSEGVNFINVLGGLGKIRWWFLSLVIPILLAVISATTMVLVKCVRFSETANVETRILGVIVDLPLNYILWFPLLFSTEICWRGAFLSRSVNKWETLRHAAVSSCVWALSLGGFIFLGYTENNFSPLAGILSVAALFFLGFYQSMIYRRSGSLLLSAFSLLCIVLVNSFTFEFPLIGNPPIVDVLHSKLIWSTVGLFVSSCLLGIAGIVMWSRQRDELTKN